MKTFYKIFMVLTLVILTSCFSQGRRGYFNNTGDESSQGSLQIFLQETGALVTLCDDSVTEDCHTIVDCSTATQYVLGNDIGGNGYCLVYVPGSSSEECSSNSDCNAYEQCIVGYCFAPINPDPVTCTSDSDCASGETCDGGLCVSSGGGNYEQICNPACDEGFECENGTCVSVCDTGYVWDYINDVCVLASVPVQTNLISLSSDLNGDFTVLFDIEDISPYFNHSGTSSYTSVLTLNSDQLKKLKRFRTFSFFAQDFRYYPAYNNYPYSNYFNENSFRRPFFIYDSGYSIQAGFSILATPNASGAQVSTCYMDYDMVSYKINANLLIDSNGIIQEDYNDTLLSITIKFQSTCGLEKTYEFVPISYNSITSSSFSITFGGDCVNELIFEGSISKVSGKHKIVISKLAFKKKRYNFDVANCFFYQTPYLPDKDIINWSSYIDQSSNHNIAMPGNFNSLDFSFMNVVGSQGSMNLIDQTVDSSKRTLYEPGFTIGASTGTQSGSFGF